MNDEARELLATHAENATFAGHAQIFFHGGSVIAKEANRTGDYPGLLQCTTTDDEFVLIDINAISAVKEIVTGEPLPSTWLPR